LITNCHNCNCVT